MNTVLLNPLGGQCTDKEQLRRVRLQEERREDMRRHLAAQAAQHHPRLRCIIAKHQEPVASVPSLPFAAKGSSNDTSSSHQPIGLLLKERPLSAESQHHSANVSQPNVEYNKGNGHSAIQDPALTSSPYPAYPQSMSNAFPHATHLYPSYPIGYPYHMQPTYGCMPYPPSTQSPWNLPPHHAEFDRRLPLPPVPAVRWDQTSSAHPNIHLSDTDPIHPQYNHSYANPYPIAFEQQNEPPQQGTSNWYLQPPTFLNPHRLLPAIYPKHDEFNPNSAPMRAENDLPLTQPRVIPEISTRLLDRTDSKINGRQSKQSYAADLERQIAEKAAQKQQERAFRQGFAENAHIPLLDTPGDSHNAFRFQQQAQSYYPKQSNPSNDYRHFDRSLAPLSNNIELSEKKPLNTKSQYLKDLDDQIRQKKEITDRQKQIQKLQDEKKEKEISDYSPFGRSGAGAPHQQQQQETSGLTGRRKFPQQHASQTSAGEYSEARSDLQSSSPTGEHRTMHSLQPDFPNNQQISFLEDNMNGFRPSISNSSFDLMHHNSNQNGTQQYNNHSMHSQSSFPPPPSLFPPNNTATNQSTQNKNQSNGEKSYLRGVANIDTMPQWRREELSRKQKMQQETQDGLLLQIAEKEAEKAKQEAIRKKEDEKELERLVKEQELLRKKYARETEMARQKEEETMLENEKQKQVKVQENIRHEQLTAHQNSLDMLESTNGIKTSYATKSQKNKNSTSNDTHQESKSRFKADSLPLTGQSKPVMIDHQTSRPRSPPIPTVLKKLQQAGLYSEIKPNVLNSVPISNQCSVNQHSSTTHHENEGFIVNPATQAIPSTSHRQQSTPSTKVAMAPMSPPLPAQIRRQKVINQSNTEVTEMDNKVLLKQLSDIQKELAQEDMKIRQDLCLSAAPSKDRQFRHPITLAPFQLKPSKKTQHATTKQTSVQQKTSIDTHRESCEFLPLLLHPVPVRSLNLAETFDHQSILKLDGFIEHKDNQDNDSLAYDWAQYDTKQNKTSRKSSINSRLGFDHIDSAFKIHYLDDAIHGSNKQGMSRTSSNYQLKSEKSKACGHLDQPYRVQSVLDIFSNSRSESRQGTPRDSKPNKTTLDHDRILRAQSAEWSLSMDEIERRNEQRLERLTRLEARQNQYLEDERNSGHEDKAEIIRLFMLKGEGAQEICEKAQDECSIPTTPSVFRPLKIDKHGDWK
ncbi:hypothetical protein O5D80_000488 [Batrachochytrium dendrobatidis]|nr:hypothetical protein O5D80_000488 [Batrachochytrium dendrobatidis]